MSEPVQMNTAMLSRAASYRADEGESRPASGLQTGNTGIGQQIGAGGFGMTHADASGIKTWFRGISEVVLSRLFKKGAVFEQNPFDDVFNGTIVGPMTEAQLNPVNHSITNITGSGNMALPNLSLVEQSNLGASSAIISSEPTRDQERF